MKYKIEHGVTLVVWGVVNLVLLVLLLMPSNSKKPALVLAKNVEETTILKHLGGGRSSGRISRGALPSLQMSYPSRQDVGEVIKYFQMTPVILNSRSNVVFLVDMAGNSLIRIRNTSVLRRFSPRARRVPTEIFSDFIAAAAKSLRVSPGKLDAVVLVPNSVERFFLNLERKALAVSGIDAKEVNLIRGRYERASGGYGVVLTEAVCKDGNVKVLTDGRS